MKSYATDALNQYTAVTGAAIAHNDGRGNLTQWKEWTYAYDAENRLTSATKTGYTVTFHYDPAGRLVRVNRNGTSEFRYYDGTQVFLRTQANGTWIDFTIWGPRPDEVVSRYSATAGWLFYHQDFSGGTAAITDMGQTVVERYLYDAYGRELLYNGSWQPIVSSPTNNPWTFTGQEFMADIGLNNYKNRFYHSELGRFIQNDPIRFDGGDLNLYRYVGNNPINGIDPTGLSEEDQGDERREETLARGEVVIVERQVVLEYIYDPSDLPLPFEKISNSLIDIAKAIALGTEEVTGGEIILESKTLLAAPLMPGEERLPPKMTEHEVIVSFQRLEPLSFEGLRMPGTVGPGYDKREAGRSGTTWRPEIDVSRVTRQLGKNGIDAGRLNYVAISRRVMFYDYAKP